MKYYAAVVQLPIIQTPITFLSNSTVMILNKSKKKKKKVNSVCTVWDEAMTVSSSTEIKETITLFLKTV